ncbi:carbohydrate ABC transporter permease [Pseudonocardia xinjiangensis]|uniref:carbohydrate ABC transporter permease n=1 Tax=Pseudonocardia xinjiangensis TaxID=75289 RepID=UPI003D8F211A
MLGNVPHATAPGRFAGPALIAPCLLLLTVFSYWPTLRSAYLSVHGTDLLGRPTRYVGAENFLRLLTDADLRRVLVTTLAIAAISTALATGAALGAALLLRRAAPSGGRLVSLVLSLPFAYSAAAASATFAGLFTPVVGVLDRTLAEVGIGSPGWLASPASAIASIAVTTAWYEFGFAFLVLIAASSRLDAEILEAAALDGAGEWRTAWSVVVPALRPSLLFLVVTQTITGLQIFTQVQVLTRGGPGNATHTLVFELYQRAFGGGFPQYGIASALSLLLLVLVVIITAAQFRFARERM